MGNLGRSSGRNNMVGYTLKLVVVLLVMQLQLQAKVWCYQHKVGDLNCWGFPSSANPDVYTKWSKNHIFRVGDSLLFLYPPSEDSVIQVTPQAYKTCNLKDPILSMKDGNSLFNITQPGEFYLTSGEKGHCQKGQKIHISLPGDGAIAYPPSQGPMSDIAAGPSYSYPTVFGSIPTPSAAASPLLLSSASFAIWLLALTTLAS